MVNFKGFSIEPDLEELLEILWRKKIPKRVHHIELFHDTEVLDHMANCFGYEKEIDFYLGLRRNYYTPWEEIWQGMEQLVCEGKIIYSGSCNFPAWNIAHANGIAKQRSFMGLISEQSYYNLNGKNSEFTTPGRLRLFSLI